MRFYAVCHTCCVVTDDYTKAEIKNNKHIDNLISDFKTIGYKGIVRVFDMDNRFVCKLKNGAVYK